MVKIAIFDNSYRAYLEDEVNRFLSKIQRRGYKVISVQSQCEEGFWREAYIATFVYDNEPDLVAEK